MWPRRTSQLRGILTTGLFLGLAVPVWALSPPPLLDPGVYLPPPPENTSPETASELAELRAIAQTRTAARFERAQHDDRVEDVTIFAEVFAPPIDFKLKPATWALFRAVLKEETAASSGPKKLFQRARPWVLDPTIAHCADAAEGSSYPSGHTSIGFATGIVLASIVPSKAQAILACANDYAYSRLVCGMHYRSDLVAGQVLGTMVSERFLSDPANKAQLEAAAAELGTVLQAASPAGPPAAAVATPPVFATAAPDNAAASASNLPGAPTITDKGKALGLGPR